MNDKYIFPYIHLYYITFLKSQIQKMIKCHGVSYRRPGFIHLGIVKSWSHSIIRSTLMFGPIPSVKVDAASNTSDYPDQASRWIGRLWLQPCPSHSIESRPPAPLGTQPAKHLKKEEGKSIEASSRKGGEGLHCHNKGSQDQHGSSSLLF